MGRSTGSSLKRALQMSLLQSFSGFLSSPVCSSVGGERGRYSLGTKSKSMKLGPDGSLPSTSRTLHPVGQGDQLAPAPKDTCPSTSAPTGLSLRSRKANGLAHSLSPEQTSFWRSGRIVGKPEVILRPTPLVMVKFP
jgi:hypothetical protein